MGAAIAGLPEQLREGAAIGAAAGARLRRPSAIVFAGMGGSAIAGELLRGLIADSCPVPITRVRSFGVPKWAGPGTLVVCVSYSGDTAETLACARQAQSQGAAILVVTAGGMLARHAEEFEQPLARVPAVITGKPRAALGLLFGAIASAFAEAGLAPPGLAEQAAAGAAATDAEEARELGLRLSETVPLVYGFGPLAIVAYRWKTQLNENAKMPAFSHAFPEFAHNEIVGWAGSGAPVRRRPFARGRSAAPPAGADGRRQRADQRRRGPDRGRQRPRQLARRAGLLAGLPRRLGQLPRGAGARRRPDPDRSHRGAQVPPRRLARRPRLKASRHCNVNRRGQTPLFTATHRRGLTPFMHQGSSTRESSRAPSQHAPAMTMQSTTTEATGPATGGFDWGSACATSARP